MNIQSARQPSPSLEWPRVRLGDVADHRLGKMLDKEKNTGVARRYLRNPNIKWFDVDLTDLQEILVEDKDVHKYEILDGDVLICEGGEAGRAALWKGDANGIIFQKACHRVRVGPRLDANYLIHRLFYDYHNGGLDDYYTGATIKHFTGQDLARYEFPLPPLPEQRRIAAILDKADALRRKRRRAIELLSSLTQSIFLEMFGDPIRGAGAKTPLISVVKKTQIGPFGSLLHREDYTEGGIPLINPMHINAGKLYPSEDYAVSAMKFDQLSGYHLAEGDIVMGRRGEMGRCAEVTTSEPMLCGTGSLFIRPDQSLAISAFLQAMLSSRSAVSYFEQASAGVTMANLNKGVVDDLKFELPPLPRQNEFLAARNRTIVSIGDAVTALDISSSLFSSLQSRAFSGQL